MLYTFQDFQKHIGSKSEFITTAINNYRMSAFYHTAIEADMYDHQRNRTINEYVRTILSLSGQPIEDFTVSNNKIASNLFRRLNTQRCTYSLGNGVTFSDVNTKKKLGEKFDTDLKKAGYKALIHGVSYCFWDVDRMHVFPATEFCPFWDEYDGTLKAGVRFWRLNIDKPLIAVLYELDGFTKYASEGKGETFVLKEAMPKKSYKTQIVRIPATNEEAVVGSENYSSLPVVPLWGSDLKQSTLVGMKESIDSFDLIRSGFANDLTDCSQIYWLIKNCGGMSDDDLARFRDRLKINHIASVDSDENSGVEPYSQDIPYQARQAYLDNIKSGIYEDFGALDVHTIAAGATNDHIDAAYQPLDENADDFEYQIIEFIQQLLALQGIKDTPIFKRNRISNQEEQTRMVLSAASYLDEETVLSHLPFISIDEVEDIIKRKDSESYSIAKIVGDNEDEEE